MCLKTKQGTQDLLLQHGVESIPVQCFHCLSGLGTTAQALEDNGGTGQQLSVPQLLVGSVASAHVLNGDGRGHQQSLTT